jgi:hypothetical protein
MLNAPARVIAVNAHLSEPNCRTRRTNRSQGRAGNGLGAVDSFGADMCARIDPHTLQTFFLTADLA